MDLGDRLIKLANKLLSAGSSETLGTQGGITNATANDILVPTSKAVKDYVDGKTIELITTTNTSDEELAATSTTLSEVKDGTMILLKVINPFTRISADCALTLTLKNGEVFGGKLINHPDSPTGILHSNIVPPNTIFLMRYNGLRWDIIDQYNLATQSFRGFMSAEDKTKLDNTYTKTEMDALNTSKVDKVTGKGLSTNDFDNTYKDYVDAYTDCLEEHITYWDNMEYTDGLSHSPLVIEKVGRVFHLHGTWKTSSSISIRTQASKQLGYFSSPAPNYPIYSPQLITNGGLYEIMVSPNKKIELTNVSKSSDLTIPANTVCYVNVMWILDW